MEKIMSKQIVVESGLDYTQRPMVAMYGCYFPDPTHADYNVLLEDCMERFDAFADKDYVIIFFAAPMEHEPSMSWIYKAYKTLSRKYKKNIKKLYVVHPSRWFRILIWIMSHIFSHKFAKKIEIMDGLDDLEKVIPIDEVFVPPVVTGGLPPVVEGENDAMLPSIRIFGAEIERSAPEGQVPAQILRVIEAMKEKGLDEEGIFRLTPDSVEVEQIRVSMDRDYNIDLTEFSSHALASALKAYFRSIPTPLLPLTVYEKFGGVWEFTEDGDRVKYIKSNILSRMSEQRRRILGVVIHLLKETSQHAEVNKMTKRTLAVVWTPNLVRPERIEDELKFLPTSQKFIEVLIELSDEIFPSEDED